MCKCIEAIDAQIKDKGERLGINIMFDGSESTVSIPTIKAMSSRPGKVNIIPVFCPFCGEKYNTK